VFYFNIIRKPSDHINATGLTGFLWVSRDIVYKSEKPALSRTAVQMWKTDEGGDGILVSQPVFNT
jgi:hypothetical protein